MDLRLAKRMNYVRASEIRELLKLTQRPSVISFAGGLPAPETFPVEKILAATERVMREWGPQSLQYSTTEGHLPLRRQIADRLRSRHGVSSGPDEIVITTGSQQGLDLSGKLFLDDGDAILCESPSYIGAINAFRAYGIRFVEVHTDDDGMIPESLEEKIANTKRVKFIYVVPDFQNPSGRSWSLPRRRALLEAARRNGIPIIEDCPYGELRYDGAAMPLLRALDDSDTVILLGTLSKVLSPGLRIGWVSASKPIIEKYVILKQGVDLHTPTFTQMVASAYLESEDLDAAIERIRSLYRGRRDAMVAACEREFPPEVRFTRPAGGLFIWVELPESLNARRLLEICLDREVAFVPGGSFFPNGGHENTIRLNFSNMPEEKIEIGIRRLGEVIRAAMENRPETVAMPAMTDEKPIATPDEKSVAKPEG